MQKDKLCPYDKFPCLREKCMAWSGKKDLEAIEREHGDSFQAMISLLAMQEGVSIKEAREIMKIRNDDERCTLIRPEPPV